MIQDESATAQIAEEPADAITEQQHLRRRLNVDASPSKHEDELDNKPFAHRREHPPPDAMAKDMRTLVAMSSFSTNTPPQGVQLACSQEIVKLCYTEAAKAITVFQTSASPDDVRLALLNVNMCLARSSEQLSQPCLAALVQSLQLPPASTVDWNPSMPGEPRVSRGGFNDSDDRQYRDKSNGRHRPHHRHRSFRGGADDDSDDRDDRRDGGVHPLVWVVVLPFFFFGLFVATKKGLKHLRKWREQRQLAQEGVGMRSEDYAPLKTQEPS